MMGAIEFSARATFHLAIDQVRWRRLVRLERISWRLLPTWSLPTTSWRRRFPNGAASGGCVEESRAAEKLPTVEPNPNN